MKRVFLLLCTSALLASSCKNYMDCSYYVDDAAQTITHNGQSRQYLLYVPSSYNGTSELPVMFNFHGFGGSAGEYMDYADMRPQAEKDTFLLVYPQGSCLNGFSHWNAALLGGDNKSDADDLGFISALIDSLIADYNVDQERIYASGYSNGGMFAYALACYESDRIAAVGSVSGAMLDLSSSCAPSHPLALINLHGTSDNTLPYDGNSEFNSLKSTLDYWINFNNTTATPTVSTNNDGGITIEHYVYDQGDSTVSVEHYKYVGGEHVWFNSTFQGQNTSDLVWNFVKRYDINGLR